MFFSKSSIKKRRNVVGLLYVLIKDKMEGNKDQGTG